MTAIKLINIIEKWALPQYQEKYDNSGLQCGDPKQEINSAIICLDCTEDVVNEAIKKLQIDYCPPYYIWRHSKYHTTVIRGAHSIKSYKNNISICLSYKPR